MKINNNLNNNKQVNFKADLKIVNKRAYFDTMYNKLIDIASKKPNSEGILFIMSEKPVFTQAGNEFSRELRFDCFDKNCAFPSHNVSVDYKAKKGEFIAENGKKYSKDEYIEKITGLFKNFVDTVVN